MAEKTEQIMVNDREEAGALLERDSSYLAIIGEHYGADIFARGNLIRLKGEEEAVDQSMRVIGKTAADDPSADPPLCAAGQDGDIPLG